MGSPELGSPDHHRLGSLEHNRFGRTKHPRMGSPENLCKGSPEHLRVGCALYRCLGSLGRHRPGAANDHRLRHQVSCQLLASCIRLTLPHKERSTTRPTISEKRFTHSCKRKYSIQSAAGSTHENREPLATSTLVPYTRESNSGYIFILDEGPTSITVKTITLVAQSSVEVEMAMTSSFLVQEGWNKSKEHISPTFSKTEGEGQT